MKAPNGASIDELLKIEEALESKGCLVDILHVTRGDHPDHGQVIVVRDEQGGYVFTDPRERKVVPGALHLLRPTIHKVSASR
jgi:hypothetical protein